MKSAQLLDEAAFAVGLFNEAKQSAVMARAQQVSIAHQQAGLISQSRQDRMVHELLAARPLPHLQSVYKEVFEKILGQRVSEAGPRVAEAAKRIDYAKRTKRPILFVMHDSSDWHRPRYSRQQPGAVSLQLADQYVVVTMPLAEVAALSQVTKQPPFESKGMAGPLFVVTQSDCVQAASVSGWDNRALNSAMAHGLATWLERDPPTLGKLRQAQRLLRKADIAAAQRVKELTIKIRGNAKKKRAANNGIVMK